MVGKSKGAVQTKIDKTNHQKTQTICHIFIQLQFFFQQISDAKIEQHANETNDAEEHKFFKQWQKTMNHSW